LITQSGKEKMADNLDTDNSERTGLLSDPQKQSDREANFRKEELKKLGFANEDFEGEFAPPNWSAVNPFKGRTESGFKWTTQAYMFAIAPSVLYMVLLLLFSDYVVVSMIYQVCLFWLSDWTVI
jgi:hypothetical protein